jgi:SAM-dependent methyltransferase
LWCESCYLTSIVETKAVATRNPPEVARLKPSISRLLVSDLEFDRIYDEESRERSVQHWTPIGVAQRAAALLTEAGATRILDVGSGVGKFCIIGALSTRADFVGVERRSRLVAMARGAASQLGASRATFVHANIDGFSVDGFNGIYLYNPFYEQISDQLVQIDEDLERSLATYRHFVSVTTYMLAALPAATVVVTFHGFGGQMPSEFELLREEPAANDWLEVWVKR